MNENFDGGGLNDDPPPYHIAVNQINNRQNENGSGIPKTTSQPPPRYTNTRDEPIDSTNTNRTVWWNPNQLPGELVTQINVAGRTHAVSHCTSHTDTRNRSLVAQRRCCRLENRRQLKWMITIISAGIIILIIVGSFGERVL